MLGNLTTALTTFIEHLYISTGLLGIVLAMALESCCIPLPSEIVMPVAGILIGEGKLFPGMPRPLSLTLVALGGALGCLLGSMAAYYIGYKGGRPLMLKYGRYVLISQHDADKADQFFQRWGSPTAFFSRLLPVVRTYISLPAGISKMPFAKFCLYTFLGSFPWCLALAYVGTIVGENAERLAPLFHALDGVVVVGLLVLIALYIWHHVRNDRRAREARLAAAEATPQGNQQTMASGPQSWNQPPSAPGTQQWGSMQQQGQPPALHPQQQPSQQWPQQPAQSSWGAPQQPMQPQWNQSQQQPQMPPQWGQQPPQSQPAAPAQPAQPPSPTTHSQFQRPLPRNPQQPPQNWPPQSDDDITIYRR